MSRFSKFGTTRSEGDAMTTPKFLVRATVGVAAGLLALGASATPALADSSAASSGAAKQATTVTPFASRTWTWGTLKSGDCQQTNGTLTLNSDGTGRFTANTLTFQTHSQDVWHATFNFSTSTGTLLFTRGPFDSPGMSDGNPPPVYFMSANFTYDPVLLSVIGKVTQTHSC
jgi:hypothetical protein